MELFKVCVAFDDGGDIYLSDAFEHQDDICLALDWHVGPARDRKHPERVVRLPKEQLKATTDSLHYEYLLPRSLPAQLRTARHAAEVPAGYAVEFSPNYIFTLQ
ncbi:hypothetical protein ACW4YW_04020 [Methylobacillus pratensis]